MQGHVCVLTPLCHRCCECYAGSGNATSIAQAAVLPRNLHGGQQLQERQVGGSMPHAVSGIAMNFVWAAAVQQAAGGPKQSCWGGITAGHGAAARALHRGDIAAGCGTIVWGQRCELRTGDGIAAGHSAILVWG